nr:MAG TPA: hypothetical protein [Caudoviricetes sp.]
MQFLCSRYKKKDPEPQYSSGSGFLLSIIAHWQFVFNVFIFFVQLR